jgi:hypothetical protein
MKTSSALIRIFQLLAVSLVGLWPVAAHDTSPSLPSGNVTFVLTWNEVSNSDVTFSGIPAGFDVGNQTYLGWCVEMNAGFALNVPLQGALLNLNALPPDLQDIDWNRILYILNHKQGGRGDVQLAIWFFTDNSSDLSLAAQAMVQAAISSGGGFVPGPGGVGAVLIAPTDANIQLMIIEVPVPQHEETPPAPTNPGTGTPGFWKNHPDAWPVTSITVGGKSYTRAQAISIMKKSVGGDKTLSMFPQLVAAMLNVMIGNDDSCIEDTIAAANAWLAANPVGSGVKASSGAWSQGSPLHSQLDAYNNGQLCAPSRD